MASASDAAIGSRVRIWWAEEGAWFEGTVSSATSRSRGTCIRYDDGQTMYEKLHEERWELLDRAAGDVGNKRRERPASAGAPARGRATRVKVEAERPSFAADDDFIRAAVEFSVAMAERSRARFVERRLTDVAGQKCYYFRELDRHSMYYVRALPRVETTPTCHRHCMKMGPPGTPPRPSTWRADVWTLCARCAPGSASSGTCATYPSTRPRTARGSRCLLRRTPWTAVR